MEFCQRTGYGDSQDCFGIASCILTWMGLGQGSRGASHGWMQLSSLIVNVMKKTGHVAEIRNPITGAMIKSVGSLFVDDSNIFVYGDRKRCKWATDRTPENKMMVKLPFQTLLDNADFSLDHAYVKMPNGDLLKQHADSCGRASCLRGGADCCPRGGC